MTLHGYCKRLKGVMANNDSDSTTSITVPIWPRQALYKETITQGRSFLIRLKMALSYIYWIQLKCFLFGLAPKKVQRWLISLLSFFRWLSQNMFSDGHIRGTRRIFSTIDISLLWVSITWTQHPKFVSKTDWLPANKHLCPVMTIIWHHYNNN